MFSSRQFNFFSSRDSRTRRTRDFFSIRVNEHAVFYEARKNDRECERRIKFATSTRV